MANAKQSSGEGRGWHGDPEGHAEAGRQSHKNDDKRSGSSSSGSQGSSSSSGSSNRSGSSSGSSNR